MFLQNASHSNLRIKLLIATLPHHLDGTGKRENAKKAHWKDETVCGWYYNY